MDRKSCKICNKEFKSLLLHLSKSKSCNERYSIQEHQELRHLAVMKKKLDAKKNYEKYKNLKSQLNAVPLMINNAVSKLYLDDSSNKILKPKVTTISWCPEIKDIVPKKIDTSHEDVSDYEKIREENIIALKKKWKDLKESYSVCRDIVQDVLSEIIS